SENKKCTRCSVRGIATCLLHRSVYGNSSPDNRSESFRPAPVAGVASFLTRRSHASAFSRASLVHVALLPAGSIHSSAENRIGRHFILSNVFCNTWRSVAWPTFSRVCSIHFFSNAFFVGRSVS